MKHEHKDHEAKADHGHKHEKHHEPKAKDLSAEDAFAAMCEDNPPPVKAMAGAALPLPPAPFKLKDEETVSMLTVPWETIFPAVMKLLKALRLPFVTPSLITLREKINGWNWPGFVKKPIIAALDVLINDPDLFKAYAAPFEQAEKGEKAA